MDYQKGKIYKIESHLGDKIYIGSTTKHYLSQRMTAHRKDYLRWKNKDKHTCHTRSFDLFDEYGLEFCEITLIETFPCNSKDELHSREAYYIKSMKCVNKVVPKRTDKEYYQDHKDILKTKCPCECGGKFAVKHKSTHLKTLKHITFIESKTI